MKSFAFSSIMYWRIILCICSGIDERVTEDPKKLDLIERFVRDTNLFSVLEKARNKVKMIKYKSRNENLISNEK